MKSEHLHDLWSSPDNSRLISKQFSFRLPVHIAAKLNAICDMYPQKNRTQLVADLLTTALENFEKSLPFQLVESEPEIQLAYNGQQHEYDDGENTIYELTGARSRFRALANRYYKEYESELGNETPKNLYEDHFGTKEFLMSIYK